MNARAGARKRHDIAPHSGPRESQKSRPEPVLAFDAEDAEVDRLIYGRVRLGIMSALAVNEPLTFNDLKSLFDVTDGNLSAHARKLEDAGYISCRKSFEGRRPKSEYRLTAAGRKALNRYLAHIEAVIEAMRRD
ncbi:MAG TPA: transcriptional regulator [Steroidobacteraceae bacterium]|nr:transcriptional regulator [Steroidobacteraceae bacterium]